MLRRAGGAPSSKGHFCDFGERITFWAEVWTDVTCNSQQDFSHRVLKGLWIITRLRRSSSALGNNRGYRQPRNFNLLLAWLIWHTPWTPCRQSELLHSSHLMSHYFHQNRDLASNYKFHFIRYDCRKATKSHEKPRLDCPTQNYIRKSTNSKSVQLLNLYVVFDVLEQFENRKTFIERMKLNESEEGYDVF